MRQLRNVFEFYNSNDIPVKIALKKFIKLHESEARQRKASDEELIRLGKALYIYHMGILSIL